MSELESEDIQESTEDVEESDIGKSVSDALSSYRKIKEGKKDLSEKEMLELDKECKIIEEREIIEIDPIHEPQEIEITGKGKIQMGPPTLTRFEKARIMGARALQLSLGAPPFIEIPENAKTSLDIAMEELEQRVIPIVIRRSLPNGDYQNIPINFFD
ncbi:MAG: DNA-directed RNA polymerase subunit K [Nitrosopumilaceae archaeon]